MKIRTTLITLTGSLLLAAGAQAEDRLERGKRAYEVTITNLTKGQVFSPPVLVTHTRDVVLFEATAPAADELALVAEAGDGGPLVDLVSALPAVGNAQTTPAPIPPGGSAVYKISGRNVDRVLSIVGMLVNTNDAFFALDSGALPFRPGVPLVYTAGAYDAGSEGNNEDCAFVPGPACPGDSGNARDTAGAEGYIYIHNGVHGIGDLEATSNDWRNPVARITITRIAN